MEKLTLQAVGFQVFVPPSCLLGVLQPFLCPGFFLPNALQIQYHNATTIQYLLGQRTVI